MQIERIALSNEDITTIRKARANDLGTYLIILFASLFFFFFTWFGSKNTELQDSWWMNYLCYTISGAMLINFIRLILAYPLDIARGYKLVLITNCKRYTESGESVTHYLLMENYGKIGFFGYNEECYLSSFSEQYKRYEIHLAPFSKVLLRVRYIHMAPDQDDVVQQRMN